MKGITVAFDDLLGLHVARVTRYGIQVLIILQVQKTNITLLYFRLFSPVPLHTFDFNSNYSHRETYLSRNHTLKRLLRFDLRSISESVRQGSRDVRGIARRLSVSSRIRPNTDRRLIFDLWSLVLDLWTLIFYFSHFLDLAPYSISSTQHNPIFSFL